MPYAQLIAKQQHPKETRRPKPKALKTAARSFRRFNLRSAEPSVFEQTSSCGQAADQNSKPPAWDAVAMIVVVSAMVVKKGASSLRSLSNALIYKTDLSWLHCLAFRSKTWPVRG